MTPDDPGPRFERERDEHLAWAKARALEYFNMGDAASAVASMLSDLRKHSAFQRVTEVMGPVGLLYLINRDHRQVRAWIEGFR